jgi:ketosteroid isomerase-like protein
MTSAIPYPSLNNGVEETRDRHIAAVNAGDAGAAAALFGPDAVFLPPGAPALQGAAIRFWFDQVFANFRIQDFGLEPDALDQHGDAIIEHGNWKATFEPKNGPPGFPAAGTYLTVYARLSDGSVRMVRDTFNGLPSSGGDHAGKAVKGEAPEQENRRIIEEVYSAFGHGDLPFILNVLADDVVWQHPRPEDIPWGGKRRGPEEVAQFFAAIAERLEVERFTPERFVVRDDRVIVFGHERMRMRSTGRVCEQDWVHAFRLRAGKIVEFREYTDTAAIVGALAER